MVEVSCYRVVYELMYTRDTLMELPLWLNGYHRTHCSTGAVKFTLSISSLYCARCAFMTSFTTLLLFRRLHGNNSNSKYYIKKSSELIPNLHVTHFM